MTFSREVTVATSVLALGALGCICGTSGPSNTPSGKVRIANLYAVDGGPGPTIDIYASLDNEFDNSPQAANAKPLVAGLAYGQLSDYVTVFDRPNNQGQLTYYLAGQKDSANCFGGCTPPSGFKPDDQATIVIGTSVDSIGTQKPGYWTIAERGRSALPAPAAGSGLLLGVDDAVTDGYGYFEWATGGACLQTNSSSSSVVNAVSYDVAPGTLQLSAYNTSTATCTEPNKVAGPTALTVTAGQTQEAFVYGTAKSSMQILIAPVP